MSLTRLLDRLAPDRFETPPILKKLAQASRKLAELKGVEGGFLHKRKVGRSNYYINVALNPILTGEAMQGGE